LQTYDPPEHLSQAVLPLVEVSIRRGEVILTETTAEVVEDAAKELSVSSFLSAVLDFENDLKISD
jgi:hypothetical protein